MKRIPTLLVVLAIATVGCQEQPAHRIPDKSQREPEVAPTLDLVDLGGKRWTNEDLSKGTYLVEFWATWCAPCRELRPKLEQLHRRYKGNGLEILYVTEEPRSAVTSFGTSQPYIHPVLLDPKGDVTKAWGVDLLPTILLVRSGRILGRWQGADSGHAIQSALKGIYGG